MPSRIKPLLNPLVALFGLACMNASAQMAQPVLGEDATRISDHVWAIMGFPNVAIVVGARATLVVDTGLGPRNGATVARVAAKLSGNQKLFLTTTHFHPEHAAGAGGFPPNTILIRDAVQQQEMEQHGMQMVEMFSSRSAQNKELLADVHLRSPDIVFDTDVKIDLGGVTARLLWFGGAHTKGDELTFVEPDGTLVSGDVVQNKVVPNIFGDGGTPSSWIAVLDKISALPVRYVLPDHSAPGDGSLVSKERAFIEDLRTRALQLKQQGVSADDAGKQLGAEFKTKYSDWPNMNVAGFVRSIYAE
ncbi:MAG TPA: MBL fold metallo-hydrolase [Bryobacteraceae bacterium]|jgi:glyoxylase-like metal-dependent hydrolase (beta-lactamase superfamily II)|nr:MBL fold metallo-hydrolase [Bryobacteraceae bacterium]